MQPLLFIMSEKLWNYMLAEKLIKSFPNVEKFVFESGFGPSGYPHIGTYAEILRPMFVIKALKEISNKKIEYIVFADDMDGLRKVPLNMPETLKDYLGVPVSKIPDPWGTHSSFSGHMIAQIMEWFKKFGLEFDTLKLSHEAYESGEFNPGLSIILEKRKLIEEIILPTLREESAEGWSPFMPTCEKCGKNLTTRVVNYLISENALEYICNKNTESIQSCGHKSITSIFDGKVKVGWKIDWALRWHTYKVNFEMYGKDLIESANISAKIVKSVFHGKPPLGYFYELYLDETGAKISKSVGQGLSVETWLAMAPKESLNLFIFKNPTSAKKLSFEAILRHSDEFLEIMKDHYSGKKSIFKLITTKVPHENPLKHRISYSLLVNLIAAVGSSQKEIVKSYLDKYEKIPLESEKYIDELIEKAKYYVDNVLMKEKIEISLNETIKKALNELVLFLGSQHEEEEIQTEIFTLAKSNGIEIKEFFSIIYKILSGQSSGPRLGSFIKLIGEKEVSEKLRKAL